MESAISRQVDNANGGNSKLLAEASFAQAFFLELSAQAATFRHRLNGIQATLRLLAVETTLLYAQIDEEMERRLATDVTVTPGKQLHLPAT